MSEFFELDSSLVDLCKEVVKKQEQKSESIFTDEYCTKQCEFLNICKLNHNACIKSEIEKILKTLSAKECKFLKLRYGYEGKVRTLEDLGLQFNFTKWQIYQFEDGILKKLRHPDRIKRLQPFMYSSLSQGKENFYARLFTKVFTLDPDSIQSILQAGPPVVTIEDLEMSDQVYSALKRKGYNIIWIVKADIRWLRHYIRPVTSLASILRQLDALGIRRTDCSKDQYPTIDDYIREHLKCFECNEPLTQDGSDTVACLCKNCVERIKRINSDKLITIELKSPEYMTYTNGRKGVTIFANLTSRTNVPFKVKLQEFTLTHSNTQKVSDYNYVGYGFDEDYLFPNTIKAIGKIWLTEQWKKEKLEWGDYCIIILKSQTSSKRYYYKFTYSYVDDWKLYDYYELD